MAGVVALCLLVLAGWSGVLVPGALGGELEEGAYHPLYGTFVGSFTTLHHKVTGDLFAVDNITIRIIGFTYDGEAPDAFFFAGNRTPKPSHRGFIIPNEKNDKEVLGPYRNKNLILKFPVTKKGQRGFFDIRWISVWCEKYAIDFGHVLLPEDLEVPAPVRAGALESENPLISSLTVLIRDTNTIILEDFTYDGSLDDAIFVVGSGDEDSSGIQLPDERGRLDSLRRYKRETLVLQLPKEARGSGNILQYVGVWSPSEGMLASVTMPSDARVPPGL